MNAAPIDVVEQIYLDAADLWLLANDPKLAGLTPRRLKNIRRRQYHRSGGKFFEEKTRGKLVDDDAPREELNFSSMIVDSSDEEESDTDQATATEPFTCAPQVVEPHRHRPELLTRIAKYPAEKQLIATLADCQSLAQAAARLGITRQAAHKTYSRLLERANAQQATRQAMEQWNSLPPFPPIPFVIGQQMDLFGGEL